MGRITLVVGWLIGIIAVIVAGFSSDPYLQHVRLIPPPHPYPTFTVLWIVLFITVQSGLVVAALRPSSYRHSWGRAIIGLVISVGFFAFAAFGSMHAPPPHAVYLLWLLAYGCIMLGLLVWSIVGAARSSAST